MKQKTPQERWKHYEESVLSEDLPEKMRAFARVAFFSGANEMMNSMIACHKEEEAERCMAHQQVAWINEISRYKAASAAAAAGKSGNAVIAVWKESEAADEK